VPQESPLAVDVRSDSKNLREQNHTKTGRKVEGTLGSDELPKRSRRSSRHSVSWKLDGSARREMRAIISDPIRGRAVRRGVFGHCGSKGRHKCGIMIRQEATRPRTCDSPAVNI